MDIFNTITAYMSDTFGEYTLPVIIIGLVVPAIVIKASRNYLNSQFWSKKLVQKHQQIANDRAVLLDSLPKNTDSGNLCDLSSNAIHSKLHSGEISPLEILHAFQRRTTQLFPLNGIADVISEAVDHAKSLTRINADSPLWAIPVSIKEHIQVKGYDALGGCIKNAGCPSAVDAVVVKALRAAGSIPFVTTSMPPGGLSQDSSNAIFGDQRHPLDRERLAGGSSGGEAIIISCGGSPLGFGTDIAGSLRIPPSFCGICGLKPTFKRISQVGVSTNYRESTAHIHVCVGPMARYVDNLADALRCLLTPAMFDADPSVPRMVFDEAQFSGKSQKQLTIGFYTFIGGSLCPQPAPSVERAVLQAKEVLEEAGHRLVPFYPPNPDTALKLLATAIFCDGGAQLAEMFHNEPLPASMRYIKYVSSVPVTIRRAFGGLISIFVNKTVGELIKCSTGCPTTADMLQLNAQINAYERAFGDALSDAGVDVILCPATAFPAPRADTQPILLDCAVLYTGLYNLVDYPAGVLPVTRVTEADEEAALEAEKQFSAQKDLLNSSLAKMQTGSRGLPVAVQVVGRAMREETVLSVMHEIESRVNFWRDTDPKH